MAHDTVIDRVEHSWLGGIVPKFTNSISFPIAPTSRPTTR